MEDEAKKETFISHLVELRNRLMYSLGAVLILFIPMAFFANDLYEYFAAPLMAVLPEGSTMISTEPHGPFFVPFKLAFAAAVAVAVPYLLYQMWAFVAPGLYENEKALAMPIIVSSTILFYLGIAFAYYVVFPIIFLFFTSTAPGAHWYDDARGAGCEKALHRGGGIYRRHVDDSAGHFFADLTGPAGLVVVRDRVVVLQTDQT